MPNSDLQILLCLTPDDFTRQRETPWALRVKNIQFSLRTCNGIHYLSFYLLNGAACLDSKINITRARFSSLVAQLTAFFTGYCFICMSYCYCGCYGCKTVFLYFFTILIRLCFFHILYKPHTNYVLNFLAESFGNLFVMIRSLLLMIYKFNNVLKT